MLFTRTIRRKMIVGMTLVLVMLIIVSVGGLTGLMSYREVVRDLDFSINEAPRRADLAAAIGMLFQPLLLAPPEQRSTARFQKFQQQAFRDQLAETRDRILDFRRKLDKLPPSPDVMHLRPVTEAMLVEVDRRLRRIDALLASAGPASPMDQVRTKLLEEIGHVQIVVQSIPDYQGGLNEKLQSARKMYRSRFKLLCWTTAIGVIMFALLVRYVYMAIFSPLCKLHQGALRVAQGDFDYRLKLTTHDEMAELAGAFNQMTERFQEIAQDLDHKARERGKQLVRSERLAGLGFLAAGVAHEINNPLQAIIVAAESLEGRSTEFLADSDPADASVVQQYLAMIRGEAFRCKEITAKLLNFARGGQDTQRVRLDLTAIVSEVLSLVGHLSKFRDRRIEFAPPGPCHAVVNGPEMKQVVLNLVSNALESMDAGGKLRIAIAEQPDQVRITFRDDGCGMTPDVIENLFEPFFTQRRDGRGTGLGLSISHRIIHDHGGTIEASSDGLGAGSTFEVRLPRKAMRGELAA